MKITFHGAAQTVTGSKHLITLNNDKKLLLDCGMFQGMGKETPILNSNFGFDPATVNYLILSHAHIDHSGLLPKLVKDGFKGKIFATPATKDLAEVLLADSARIQLSDVKYINKHKAEEGLPLIEPLYSEVDVVNAIKLFEIVDYDTVKKIDDDITFMFTDAGHIIGSAVVNISVTENDKATNITFSGDVGRYRDVILRSPNIFPQAHYILIESTYGDSLHQDFLPTPEMLLQHIQNTCIAKKGKLIIPAFSVGRTQEILYALNCLELENKLPNIPYFVDSPLSVDATEIITNYPKYFNEKIQKVLENDENPFGFKGLKFIKDVAESKALNLQNQPCVIISSSGMAEAGRVKHHIKNNISNANNTILLSGYCEPNSLGGRLKANQKEVNIFGKPYEVKAEIAQMRSMSAHGDYEDLIQFLACQNKANVNKIFLVHGEFAVQKNFKEKLINEGFNQIEIPEMHQTINLD